MVERSITSRCRRDGLWPTGVRIPLCPHMKSLRPITTLFLLASVDGKISTGSTNVLDIDQDFPKIKGVREGLYQYYELEKWTDLFSLNSGRVLAKVGANTKKWKGPALPVTFVVIDNKPHLSRSGLNYLSDKAKALIVVTTNKKHPSFKSKRKNVHTISYPKTINWIHMMYRLRREFGAARVTVQTGGTLNAEFLRQGLIDRISLVIAPVLVGGTETQSIIGGKSLKSLKELSKLKALKLKSVEKLKNSYLHLQYDVLK